MRYDVNADIYEGPLPLLVELAKLNLIDIFLVKLVGLTQAYLQLVKVPPAGQGQAGPDLNQLSEPLPLLSHLVALKARGLLPRPPAPEGDEEVPISLDELERRLKEYEQFKTVAQLLAQLHALQHEHFTRATGEAALEGTDTPPEEQPFEVGISDLMGAFAKVLERATAPVYEVRVEPWTVEEKFKELRMLLTVKRHVRFVDLFTPEQDKLELVVTFLALLELMRQRIARAIQERQFGDILIARCEGVEETVHSPQTTDHS
jgi:segregation and condensation protein A